MPIRLVPPNDTEHVSKGVGIAELLPYIFGPEDLELPLQTSWKLFRKSNLSELALTFLLSCVENVRFRLMDFVR